MRRKIREKGDFEKIKKKKEKKLEVHTDYFYFYKIYVPYMLHFQFKYKRVYTKEIMISINLKKQHKIISLYHRLHLFTMS